jgi:hypothetical protein
VSVGLRGTVRLRIATVYWASGFSDNRLYGGRCIDEWMSGYFCRCSITLTFQKKHEVAIWHFMLYFSLFLSFHP